jgi:hypothetical protein
MKIRRNIILFSCIFCYFAGLWIISTRFGLVKLLMRYGVSEAFDAIPKNFPQMIYLYYGLIGYTILFAIITYFIYKFVSKAWKEQEVLQQQANEIFNYAEEMNIIMSAYERYAKSNNITDKEAGEKLKLIQRQISALPPAIVRNPAMSSNLSGIIKKYKVNFRQNLIMQGYVLCLIRQ